MRLFKYTTALIFLTTLQQHWSKKTVLKQTYLIKCLGTKQEGFFLLDSQEKHYSHLLFKVLILQRHIKDPINM